MAYSPVGFINPQYYVDYANWWLKGYQQATTTPLSMATDSSGLTQIVRAEITSAGFIKTSGGALFTPHFNQAYDIWIFPTAAEADANDTTNAIQVADNLSFSKSVDELLGGAAVQFDTVSAMTSSISDQLSVGRKILTKGYLSSGDRGAAVYIVAAPQAVDEKSSHTLQNGNVAILQWSDRVLCTQFGIFPDGVTEWQDNGFNDVFLQFLRDNDVTGVFVAGDYRSKLDNFYSNVSIYCEPGAFWGGTVHAAINSDSSNPNLDRPQNVVWKGQIGTYERVGSFNCDNVEIESIIVKEDVSKNPSGLRGAGVHIYNSSKNMAIGSIIVEASERSYGIGIDSDNSEFPESIHIGSVHIKKSYTHGAAFVCKDTKIDQLIIDDYGVGLLSDPNLTASVPGSTVPTTDLQGFIVDGGEYPQFGQVIVRSSNPSADASRGAWMNSTSAKVDALIIRDAPTQGLTHTSVAVSTIDEIDVRSSGSDGINNQGNITSNKITVVQNGDKGIEHTSGTISAQNILSNNNVSEGFLASAGVVSVGGIVCSNNNAGGWQVLLSDVSGVAGNISTSRTASGVGGGVYFQNDLSGFSVESLSTLNDGLITGDVAAVLIQPCDGLSIQSAHIKGDNGSSSGQPLRMLTINDVNINGLIIENEFNGNGIAGATYTRLGFTNSNNKTGITNISRASGAAEFNCLNCTNP